MNEFTLTGTCIGDLEVHTTPRGNKYGRFPLSVKRGYREKDGTYPRDTYEITVAYLLDEDEDLIKRDTPLTVHGHISSLDYLDEKYSLVADVVKDLRSLN